MKTKLNRIVSALLLSVMLFSSVSVLLPLTASAAASESYVSAASDISPETVVKDAMGADRPAAVALAEDIENGYVDYYTNGQFSIYVNRYTGVLYYKNEATGQILTSNPTETQLSSTNRNGSTAKKLLSQITVAFFENANTSVKKTYDSTTESAVRGQISVSAIKNGLRVNYAIGNTDNRYLLPNMITAERFHELLLEPLINQAQRQWAREYNAEKLDHTYNNVYYLYKDNAADYVIENADGTYNLDFVMKYIGSIMGRFTDSEFRTKALSMYELLSKYSLNAEGKYVLAPNLPHNIKADSAKILRSLCPEYDFDTMYADEKAAGYVQQVENIPVFRCALEYTLNTDGSLNVALPANSIVYDESFYTMEYITVLPFFGAGKMQNRVYDKNGNMTSREPVGGYLFYPDGSGMILDFSDFAGQNFSLQNNIFGNDSAYSSIDEMINYRGEQITMPVFGIVNEVPHGDKTVTNGFFAIMEDGAAMSTLSYVAETEHEYLAVYPTYTPYPSDVYNLSNTISVGGLGDYIIVSDSKYTGTYNTRFVMLTDPTLATAAVSAGQGYYEASYVGMANYYRDYLKANGTLKAISDYKSTLPLYIETFGAMDVMDRFLSFPVTTSIPLTTFDDVANMYSELKDAGIKNINFRLTGFANGGMTHTYPVRSRWERACGGKSDFKDLLATAAAQSTGDQNFGLFPEFDFMYLTENKLFDGMTVKGNVACMVDNRYASKQVFSSVLSGYEGFLSLIVTPDKLLDLYAKFLKRYDNYDITNLSVSTMGTDLNSNFDEKNSVNREQAKEYVTAALATMNQKYNLMIDGGNAYALKYASHILNIATDSSHYRYASYTVPFVGMILHGYISYAGAPLNYAGNAQYDALRSIESGAAPYYILAYQEQNTKKLKEDENLSKYYGVTYATWKDSVIETYKYINAAIGGLQDYEIVDHAVLVAERVWDVEEIEKNYVAQKESFLKVAKAAVEAQIAETLAEMKDAGKSGYGLKVTIDRDLMVEKFMTASHRAEDDAKLADLEASVESFCSAIEANYNGMSASCPDLTKAEDAEAKHPASCGCKYETLAIEVDAIELDFKSYVTSSDAMDKLGYVNTNYTVDNGNVVMVTYQKGTKKVNFILNYNSYAVTVRMDGELVKVGSYAYAIYE